MNEFDEDDGTIIIAELEWAPQVDFIDWSDPNFSKDIVDRINGVTVEGFAKEVELWQKHINMLPKYDEFKIRKEISAWDFSTPDKDAYDFQDHAIFYARQVQYKNRLSELHNIVFSHYELISQAQKALKEMAVKVAPGSNKHDKDGIAAFTVNPFTVAMSDAKRLLMYIESIGKNIEFAASQFDKLTREHQFLSRINNNLNNEGLSAVLMKNHVASNKENDIIKTSNKRFLNR